MNPETKASLTRICRIIMYVLCAAAVILSFYLTDPEVSGPGHGFVRLLIISAFPFFLLERLLNFQEGGLRVSWASLILLVFGLGAVLSGLRPGTPYQGRELVQWFLIAFLLLLMVGNLARDRVFFWLMLSAVLAAGISLAVFGIDQKAYQFDQLVAQVEAQKPELLTGLSPGMQRAYMARVNSREVFATFMHPNTYGACMGALFLLSGALSAALFRQYKCTGKGGGAAAAAAAAAALPAIGLILSKSKGAMGAAAAAGVFLFCLRSSMRRRWKALVAGGCAVAVLVMGLSTSLLDASINVRRGYWQAGWGVIKEAPLTGVKAGKFAHHYTLHKGPDATEVQNPHNIYLRLWAELGLPLALIFLAGWIVFFFSRPAPGPGPPPEPAAWSPWLGAVCLMILPVMGLFFRVWQECSGIGGLAMVLCIVTGAGLFILMRDRDPLKYPLVTGACRAVVFLFLLHSLIDFDLAIPGIMVLTVICAGLVIGGRPGMHLKGRAALIILLGGLALWPWLYLRAGLRTFECRMQVAEIDHLRRQKPVDWAAIGEKAGQAQKKYPDMDRFISLQAEYYAKTGRIEAMLDARKALADLHVNNAAVWSHLGRGNDARGRLVEGAIHHRKAIELYPLNPRFRLFYARNLRISGRIEEARQQAREALEVNRRIIDRNVKLSPGEIAELEGI